MRLTIFIILSSVYLIGATELHQLLKLPFLVAHYRHHQQEDRSISLVDFLKIHYTGNHPADNDEQEDERLPFKSDGNIIHLDLFIPVLKENLEKTVFPASGLASTVHPEGILANRSFSIFRPPRLV